MKQTLKTPSVFALFLPVVLASLVLASPPAQSQSPATSPASRSSGGGASASPVALPGATRTVLTNQAAAAAPAGVIAIAPNDTVSATVSLREINRIAVVGAKILHAFWKEGTAEVSKSRGELRLIPAEKPIGPINLIISTDKGATYTLVLLVQDLPSQTILLQDTSEVEKPATASATMPALAPLAKSDGFEKAVKGLVTAMASDAVPADAAVLDKTVSFNLWNEVTFVLNRSWTLRDLVGDRFLIKNVTQSPIRLAEQEFYKPGVHAIAIDRMELEPGQSSYVYIVRERGDHE